MDFDLTKLAQPNCCGMENNYSQLSLSRTSRDLIKMFEFSVVRDNQTVTSLVHV